MSYLKQHPNKSGLISFILVLLALSGNAFSQDIYQRYFDGLRQRRLYIIAEDYAVELLNGQRLLFDEQAQVTIQLALTLAEHGSHVQQDQRNELWQEAERLLSDFSKTSANNPRLIQVQAELAILPARFGDVFAWESQVFPNDKATQEVASDYFQRAINQIDILESTQFRKQSKPTESEIVDGALSGEEFGELGLKLSYFKAKSRLYLAMFSQPSPNKAGQLIDAAQQLETLSKSRIDSIWKERARLLRAKLARYEKEFAAAESILKSLARDPDSANLRDEILAERVRIQIDQGKIDSGLKLITDEISAGRMISDEVRSVAVEGLIAAWKIADDQGQKELQAELFREALGHHELTRGKWRQLTHARTRVTQQSMELGGELASIVHQAQQSYRNGDSGDAVKQFRLAAAVAHRERKQSLAIEYAFTAGSIEVQRQNWAAAAEVFSEIVGQFPDEAKASDAALMKAFAYGQIYLEQPNADSRRDYEEALRETRGKFSGTSAAGEATWMLAAHNEQRLQWTDALEVYRKIDPASTRFDSASLRIAVLYDNILTRLKTIGGPVAEWEDRLVEEIVRIEDSFPDGNVLRSLEQCQASLLIARLLLQHRDRWYGVADQWLERVSKTVDYQHTEASISGTEIDPKWIQVDRAASQMRIVSLAGQENLRQARAILLELHKTDPATMLGILVGLTEMTSQIDERYQVELGHLQLEAIQRLNESREILTPQQRSLLDRSHAEAFIAIGNLPEAAEIYVSLLEDSPRNESLIRQLIAVLMKRGKAEDLVEARKWWAKFERMNPSGSEKWIEARLEIAKLDHRVGKTKEAQKLLGVTQALYPKLGSPSLKRDFENFRAEITNP